MVGNQEQWQKPEEFQCLLCQEHIGRKHAPSTENLTAYNMPQGTALFTNVFCYNSFINLFTNQWDFISLIHLSLNEYILLSLSPSLPTHLAPSLLLYHIPSTIPSPCVFSLGLHGHRLPRSFSMQTSFWFHHPLALHFSILTTSLDPLELVCTEYSLLFPLSLNESPMTHFQCPNSHM